METHAVRKFVLKQLVRQRTSFVPEAGVFKMSTRFVVEAMHANNMTQNWVSALTSGQITNNAFSYLF